MLLAVLGLCGCRKATPQIIVCIGDSLTACGGEGGRYTDWLQQWLPNDRIINKGINGDTLAGGRERFDRDVLSYKPDVVVIALGANDFWQNKRGIEQLRQDLELMVVRAQHAGAQVVIASCFGQRDYLIEEQIEYGVEKYGFADDIGKMEQEVCRRYNCFYVPNMQIDIKPNGSDRYWSDKYHPSKTGNRYVAKRIYAELKKAIAKKR